MCFPLAILFFIGLGTLELTFPNALSLSTLNDNYTGKGWSGIVVLVFELILAVTWGRISGIILIAIGLFWLGIWIMSYAQSKSEPLLEPVSDKKDNASVILPITSSVIKSAFSGYRKNKSRKKEVTD